VRLITGDDAWEGASGDHLTVPPQRHSLAALEDSVVLLTVSNRVP
jgi:quercetin dioxygenase-like cupin family protein